MASAIIVSTVVNTPGMTCVSTVVINSTSAAGKELACRATDKTVVRIVTLSEAVRPLYDAQSSYKLTTIGPTVARDSGVLVI